MSITYELRVTMSGPSSIIVRLGGKVVGSIRKSKGGGFHYAPKGGGWGETFPTVSEVKASIEGGNQ